MEQFLSISQDVTTVLLPIVLILIVGVMFLVIRLLVVVNRTASAIKETTFLVNNMIHGSFFKVTDFIQGLFEGRAK